MIHLTQQLPAWLTGRPRPNVSPFDSATSFVSHLAAAADEKKKKKPKGLCFILWPPFLHRPVGR
jgi:hypothetical protein